MVAALDSGKLGGAYLDVWYNDMGGRRRGRSCWVATM